MWLLDKLRRNDKNGAPGKLLQTAHAPARGEAPTVNEQEHAQQSTTPSELRLNRPANDTVLEMLLRAEVSEMLELALPALWLYREQELAKIKAELEANDRAISRLTMQRDDILSVEKSDTNFQVSGSNMPRFVSPGDELTDVQGEASELKSTAQTQMEKSNSTAGEAEIIDDMSVSISTPNREDAQPAPNMAVKPKRGRPPKSHLPFVE